MIITDRDSQFQSTLFREFTKLLRCSHVMTTAYHSSANGLLERFHRQLITTPMTTETSGAWSDNMPLVLSDVRSLVEDDKQRFVTVIVFGAQTRLPGEYSHLSALAIHTPYQFVYTRHRYVSLTSILVQ